LEIKKQQFKKALRGYDTVEVETFLEKIAEDFGGLLQENTQLSKQLASVEAELKHYKDVEKTLKQTLYSVQQSTQLTRENSLKEANLIKKEAELSAIQIVDEARVEARQLEEEALMLKQQKDSMATRLRHLLSSQLELLEILQMDDTDRGHGRDRNKRLGTDAVKPAAPPAEAATEVVKEIAETVSTPDAPVTEETAPAMPEDPEPQEALQKDRKKGEELLKDILGEHLDEY
jgi:cell division initiation protein